MFRKTFAGLLVLVLVLATIPTALASNFYLIPDSNSRRLTREELWTWQYDALGYVFNEIFARHGYHFIPGQKYDSYFRAQVWYQEHPTRQTNQEVYELLNNVEWANERLCKEVREEMRVLGTTNPNGKRLPAVSYEPPVYGAFSSFKQYRFSQDQKFAVYSGPGEHYHRSANGKASVSTNGLVYVGGWEGGWLQVMYWTNDANIRIGFVSAKGIKEKVIAPMLQFSYLPMTLANACALTDDPVQTFTVMAQLPAGKAITYLGEAVNHAHWAYIEVYVNGVPMRGYIPMNALGQSPDMVEVDDWLQWAPLPNS